VSAYSTRQPAGALCELEAGASFVVLLLATSLSRSVLARAPVPATPATSTMPTRGEHVRLFVDGDTARIIGRLIRIDSSQIVIVPMIRRFRIARLP
jgi:hypothetical protein